MRTWVFSDLHQEWPENTWEPTIPDGTELIIAAGDIHSPLTSALRWLHERFAGIRTIYVPGNHDFWMPHGGADDRYTLWDQLERGRALADLFGIDLLVDDIAYAGSTRIIGATLWTDYRLGVESTTIGMRQASREMNDYRRIRRKPSGSHNRIRADEILAIHRASRAFIERMLSIPHDGPTVVVTHHGPHPLSASAIHRGLSQAYASDLTEVIEQGRPDLWIHGHIHEHRDYRVGGTRILANPRGHVDEQSDFEPGLTFAL